MLQVNLIAILNKLRCIDAQIPGKFIELQTQIARNIIRKYFEYREHTFVPCSYLVRSRRAPNKILFASLHLFNSQLRFCSVAVHAEVVLVVFFRLILSALIREAIRRCLFREAPSNFRQFLAIFALFTVQMRDNWI